MKIIVISFLAAFLAAPVIGPGALIVGLLVLAGGCFLGAAGVSYLERPVPCAVDGEPVLDPETDDYLTALENDEDRWVPSGLGKETPFLFEGAVYLKVVNHLLDDFGYLNLATGKITRHCGYGEEIAQVPVEPGR